MSSLFLLMGCVLGLHGDPAADSKVLFDFSSGDLSKWSTIQDTVMGGRSTGALARTDKGALSFTGTISLENNGGFASFRSARFAEGEFDLAGSAGLEVRVKGDGRSYIYSCDMRGVPIFGGGYWQEFSTVAGEWLTIRLPWNEFVPTNFGRKMAGQPAMDSARLATMGVYLYDKKSGDFELEVDSISAYWAGDEIAVVDTQDIAFPDDFSTLLRLVESLDLDEALRSFEGEFTLFAPTNAAFEALPDGLFMDLARPANSELLKSILLDHVVEGRVPAARALELSSATSLGGKVLSLNTDAAGLKVANARVLATDLEFAGGVVHAIDAVIVLDDRAALLPKKATDPLAEYSTVLNLIESAGLKETLDGKERYTLFAPTNAAFAALPAEVLEALARPENLDALRAVLLHHVIDSGVTGYAALQLASPFGETGVDVSPISGPALNVVATSAGLTVDGAAVKRADLLVGNAVVHVVDQVLVPSDLELKLAESDAVLAALEASVARGLVSFNAGEFAVCAEGYRTALEALLFYDQLEDSALEGKVQKALDRAGTEAPRAASWTLRYAMDAVRLSR